MNQKTSTSTTTKVNSDLEVNVINGALKSIKIFYKDDSLKTILKGFEDIMIQGISIKFIKAESLLEDEDSLFNDEDEEFFEEDEEFLED
jgi:hypothetical protein